MGNRNEYAKRRYHMAKKRAEEARARYEAKHPIVKLEWTPWESSMVDVVREAGTVLRRAKPSDDSVYDASMLREPSMLDFSELISGAWRRR